MHWLERRSRAGSPNGVGVVGARTEPVEPAPQIRTGDLSFPPPRAVHQDKLWTVTKFEPILGRPADLGQTIYL
jgi:hypothetical protein